MRFAPIFFQKSYMLLLLHGKSHVCGGRSPANALTISGAHLIHFVGRAKIPARS